MKAYNITLDFEDGTADGCRLQSNGHDQKGAIEMVKGHAPDAYFEFSNSAETEGGIWVHEAAASKGKAAIGKFVIRDIAS